MLLLIYARMCMHIAIYAGTNNTICFPAVLIITLLVMSATGQIIEFDASLNDTIYIEVCLQPAKCHCIIASTCDCHIVVYNHACICYNYIINYITLRGWYQRLELWYITDIRTNNGKLWYMYI